MRATMFAACLAVIPAVLIGPSSHADGIILNLPVTTYSGSLQISYIGGFDGELLGG